MRRHQSRVISVRPPGGGEIGAVILGLKSLAMIVRPTGGIGCGRFRPGIGD